MLERSSKRLVATAGLLLLMVSTAALSAETQTWNTDTPAGRRLEAAIKVINAGDMDAVKSFIADNHTRKSVDYFGEEELFDVYYGIFERYNGLDFHHVKESSTDKEVAVFRCRLTGTGYLFGLTVESESPHRIRGMTILPLADVDENAGSTELAEEETAKRLSFVLDRFEEHGVFSGVVLVAKNGRIVFHDAYGWANREAAIPATVNTKFNLASLNKMFTAVAIAQLCEKGELSYEDPIGKFLGPDWIPMDIGEKVKIKHLLSHTSGIGGENFNLTYVEEAVARGFTQIDDYKNFTVGTDVNFEPGTKFEYSNLGYHLLGAIIEQVSGETYFAYIKSYVFERAEMTGAELCESGKPLPDMAIGYEKICESDTILYRDNRSRIPIKATPAGLGYATANDLMQFAQAMRRNALVTAETREILFAPKLELNSPRYGFGFRVRAVDGRRTVSHTGGYIGINNSFSMGLDDGETIIILSNLDILTGTVCDDIGILIEQMRGRMLE
jgi:CubicO group peptidase (beta-lactamase class C family)